MELEKKTQLIALDLDGTSLNNLHEFSPKLVKILRKLSSAGLLISITTGRSTIDVLDKLKILDLKQDTVPCVTYNGGKTFIARRDGEKYFVHHTIFSGHVPEDISKRLIKLSIDLGLVLQYYNGDDGNVYAVPLTDEHISLLDKYANLVGRKQVLIGSYDEVINKFYPTKILILTNDTDALISEARRLFTTDEVNIICGTQATSSPYFVEFLHPSVTKGVGLRHMCEYLNISTDQTIAFGDGDNDKELISYSGTGNVLFIHISIEYIHIHFEGDDEWSSW